MIMIGRFFFVVCISLITIRHIIIYFYVFKWKYVVLLNDDFFSQWITTVIFVLSFVFEFISYYLGYHNEDLDYHICSGNNPFVNINETLKLLSRPKNTSCLIFGSDLKKLQIQLTFFQQSVCRLFFLSTSKPGYTYIGQILRK